MKYAICNETFQDWPLDRALAFARECGYTGIEFAPFTLGADAYSISNDQRTSIRRATEAAGLETVGLHWLLAKTQGYYLTTPDEAVRRKTAAYLRELVRLCHDLGGSILVLGSPLQRNLLPGVSHDQALDFAADVLRETIPTLRECRCTLAVEPLGPQEGDFLLTAEQGVQLIEKVAAPECRLHLDVKAMSSEASPVHETIRRFAPWMVHFHANDPNRRGPGMGELDFSPILAALRDVRYQGWVSVEVFDYAPGSERLATESIDYLRRIEAALPE